MKTLSDFRVVCVDAEFRPQHGREGNPLDPVCLVAKQWPNGPEQRIWFNDPPDPPPCPFGPDDLVVAFYASAEMGCFEALGWPAPKFVLDLYAEFRMLTNGKTVICGNNLIGALTYFGCNAMPTDEKDAMRSFILDGGPWDSADQTKILDYCAKDVDATLQLLSAMEPHIDLPRALLRGAYGIAVASMERRGIPLDVQTLDQLRQQWPSLKQALIQQVDQSFNVYQGEVFRQAKFSQYLKHRAIAWPLTATGLLALDDETFKEQSMLHPELQPLYQLRKTLAQGRLGSWPIGDDGRNRCLLSMFSSKTGRNQPSTSRFIFGAASWLRGLIQPAPGYGLAYIDWSQQEFGIAAALSRDQNMQQAYKSGDPYLAFAKQAGAVPQNATAQSHSAARALFKQCVLAVQYGMGEETLAKRIGQPVFEAKRLLSLHRRTYATFWQWSDRVQNTAQLKGKLQAAFGWQLHTNAKSNVRSIGNFPMQANGAEMLRIACILMVGKGIGLCAPVHDAVLIEAPLDRLDEDIAKAQECMREASRLVLAGFELGSDVKVIRHPERFQDERGVAMWDRVMGLLNSPSAPNILTSLPPSSRWTYCQQMIHFKEQPNEHAA
ncbi:DNA polymerase [Pseudomonas helleri]|uniref:DNA polymerase n=1 Tax=Pseudomonas helleri TaxID=1608996 RepID=UPI001E4FB92B|nr:DNA polymerase [Pseudomonas helleri]